MPAFLPFRALRPTKDLVAKFSAKTSDFKNPEDVLADMQTNTESYYYVTKQSLLSPVKKPIEFFFTIGAGFINKKTESGDLFKDKVPCFYVYRQIDHSAGRTYTGIIGLVDVLDLENNLIKKHELTKVVREEYLYKQLHFTGVLGEPVLMGHQHSIEIDNLIEKATKKTPEYDFKTIDNKEHIVWQIKTSLDLQLITESFEKLPAFYIADGHHRCASTIRNYKRNPESNNRYFMVFLLDENQFHIESFHRLLHGLTPEDTKDLKEKIQAQFEVEDYKKGELFKPQKHSEFGLLTRDLSLKLTLKKEPKTTNPEAHLDVSILEKKFFMPIMNIHHPRTDHRLSYIASSQDFNSLKQWLVNGDIDMVISNFPISFDEVKQVADANKTMPPKSTYIEPKLRGGMIVQKF
ncbi:MAG: DUF1015 family protein [Bacteroidia bacterium]